MRDIYQYVTDKIVTALDQGVVPWIKPWSSSRSIDIDHQPYPINASRDVRIRASIYRCSGPRPG